MEQNLPTWLIKLKQTRALGETDKTDTPGTLTLPEHLPSLLSKPRVAVFLGLPKSSKESKEVLMQQLLALLTTDEQAKTHFFEMFVQELAVGPGEVEALLGCTTTERKLWTSDGKLPILAYRTFRKAGRDLPYPVHDRRVILALTQTKLAQWRAQHQSLVQLRRKTGVKKALESRETNTQTRQNFRTLLEEMMQEWEKNGNPQLVAAFRLAFWTQWASRWAKENQVKSLRAIKHQLLYQARQDAWYKRKDEALHVLARTPYTQLSFYKPEEPDKRNYYALYSIEVTSALFPELSFSFHIPYPFGKTFLPSPKKLPQVEHTEQDGMFRFGRPLLDDERMFYREKDVEANFTVALSLAQELYGR